MNKAASPNKAVILLWHTAALLGNPYYTYQSFSKPKMALVQFQVSFPPKWECRVERVHSRQILSPSKRCLFMVSAHRVMKDWASLSPCSPWYQLAPRGVADLCPSRGHAHPVTRAVGSIIHRLQIRASTKLSISPHLWHIFNFNNKTRRVFNLEA